MRLLTARCIVRGVMDLVEHSAKYWSLLRNSQVTLALVQDSQGALSQPLTHLSFFAWLDMRQKGEGRIQGLAWYINRIW